MTLDLCLTRRVTCQCILEVSRGQLPFWKLVAILWNLTEKLLVARLFSSHGRPSPSSFLGESFSNIVSGLHTECRCGPFDLISQRFLLFEWYIANYSISYRVCHCLFQGVSSSFCKIIITDRKRNQPASSSAHTIPTLLSGTYKKVSILMTDLITH